MRISAYAALVLATLSWAGAPRASVPVLYDNGVAASDVDAGFASQLSSGDLAFNAQVADDFSLAAGDWAVTDAHWDGIFLFGDPPDPTDFNLIFYADDGGKPTGDGLADPTSTAIAVREVSVSGVDTGFDLASGADILVFWADFDPVFLDGLTTYWFTVQADFDAFPQWFWGVDTGGGNAVGGFDLFSIPFWSPLSAFTSACDGGCAAAFQLTGHSIPEPGTLGLLGAGLTAMGLFWRRRRPRRLG